jgi:hypothetical protein
VILSFDKNGSAIQAMGNIEVSISPKISRFILWLIVIISLLLNQLFEEVSVKSCVLPKQQL